MHTYQCKQRQTGSQTVDTVNQVDGIVDEHHHEDGQRDADVVGDFVDAEQTVEIVDVKAGQRQQTACEYLYGKLCLGVQTCQVVDDTRDVYQKQTQHKDDTPERDRQCMLVGNGQQ